MVAAGLASTGRADDPILLPPGSPDTAGLEKRLAGLEKQLAALMKEVQSIRKDLKTQAPKVELKVLILKNATALHVASVLHDLLGGKVGKTIHIVAEPVTNRLLVKGTAEQLRLVEALVARLDEPAAERKVGAEPLKKAEAQLRLEELKARLTLLQSDLDMRQDRAAWSARMVKKGFLTAAQGRSDQAAVEAAAIALEQARRELRKYLPDQGKATDPERKPGS
jgi:hypothetical protein